MNKTFLYPLSLVLMLLLSVGEAPALTLRVADVQEENYPTVLALKHIGQLLSERSGGRLSVEVFHSRQLGEEKESIEQCQAGGLDMVRTNLAPLIDAVPEAGVPALPDTIVADDRILRQILYNLLSNATKFTGEGGSIELRVDSIAWVDGHLLTSDGKRLDPLRKGAGGTGGDIEFVEVTVADTGAGIREEDLERIFNPFEQVDSSLSRRIEGTGLGLALTREFVQLHGGLIWAESQGPGRGSSFRFIIPVAQATGERV